MLNGIGYDGPLFVEREEGAKESAAFARGLDFEPSSTAFDAAFAKEG